MSRALNLSALKGAEYADVRVAQTAEQTLTVKNGLVDALSFVESSGVGVRVLVNGAWGFASSRDLSNEEVERVLMAHTAVGEACVFGISDPEWGQSVAAAVVLREACDGETLIQFLRGQVAGYKVPRRILFVESLPHTASGKLRRAEVAIGVQRLPPLIKTLKSLETFESKK